MSLEDRKISFVQEFLKIENEDTISRLEKLLQQRNAELNDDTLKPMSIEAFNERIDRSMEDSRNGRLTKAADLKAKMEKWG